MIAEYDESGNEIRSYGYQPDSTWTTDPLWLKQDGEYYFYQNDHLGTPQKLVGVNGAVVWNASYEAFGKAHVHVETVTNNLRFPGQYYDEETGLHYNWYRYYSPEIGNYFKKDPIGFWGKDPNLYRYSENNPITVIDPLGLSIYFAIYYNKGTSFERAAKTWENELKNRSEWSPTCDIVLLEGVRTKFDFIRAWNVIDSTAREREAQGFSGKIKEGIIFTHATKDGSWPGLEFEPPSDSGESLGPEFEVEGPPETLTEENIIELPILLWESDGVLHLQGCNTGISALEDAPSLAEEFANTQHISVSGQNGFSYFSENDLRYVKIDRKGDGTSTKVYLKSYNRRYNRPWPHIGGDGKLILPVIIHPPSLQ